MIAIVVVGYSRPAQTKRLLDSIVSADYGSDKVDLIISIDKGKLQEEVRQVAEATSWPYGNKKIRCYPERQGLRPHILQCGDIANEYDAVIVLEDDLVVAPDFYNYTKQCIAAYDCDERVAGISLYAHAFLPPVLRPFVPEWSGHDGYFMQYAQSWGQCWTKRMWQQFRQWYNQNENHPFDDPHVPQNVRAWKSSWLKYNIQYIVEKNLFFIYPYHSLTTNLSEVGEHARVSSASFQVPMFRGHKEYALPTFEQGIKYDAFWERIYAPGTVPHTEGKPVCMDLYGYKTAFDDCDYLISTASRPYRVLNSFQLSYRPHEINCIMQAPGQDIFLYDLHTAAAAPQKSAYRLIKYDIKEVHFKNAWLYFKTEFLGALRMKFRLFFKK